MEYEELGEEQQVEVQKTLEKVFANWVIESDFILFERYCLQFGDLLTKDYIWHKLGKEINYGKANWFGEGPKRTG